MKAITLLLQLDGFYGTGADIEANEVLFSHTFLKHVYLFLTAKRERILCCCRRRARAFRALETRLLAVFGGVTGLSIFKTDSLDRLLRRANDSEAGRAFSATFNNQEFSGNFAFRKAK